MLDGRFAGKSPAVADQHHLNADQCHYQWLTVWIAAMLES
jgi:hypothetical protein